MQRLCSASANNYGPGTVALPTPTVAYLPKGEVIQLPPPLGTLGKVRTFGLGDTLVLVVWAVSWACLLEQCVL